MSTAPLPSGEHTRPACPPRRPASEQPPPPLLISADNIQGDLLSWAILVCRNAGLVVEMPHEWETPKEFCFRLGISGQTLIRKLRDPRCPQIEVIRGKPKGRLQYLAATQRFERFCSPSSI